MKSRSNLLREIYFLLIIYFGLLSKLLKEENNYESQIRCYIDRLNEFTTKELWSYREYLIRKINNIVLSKEINRKIGELDVNQDYNLKKFIRK